MIRSAEHVMILVRKVFFIYFLRSKMTPLAWLLLVSFFWHFLFLFVASRCNLMVGVGVRTAQVTGSFHPDPREMRSRAAGRSPFEAKRDTRHLKQITTSV